MKKRTLVPMLAMLAALTTPAAVEGQVDWFNKFTGSEEPAPKKIAHFSIEGALVETPVKMPPLFGNKPPMSFKGLLEGLKKARHDDDVVAVVIDLHEARFGFAQLEEFHAAVRKFAAVDKEVYVHADTLTTRTYAAATAASHISIVPTGDLWLLGLYFETPYVRGGLDKLGIAPDIEHCGDFKTGAEPLTRTEPSEQSKEMMKWLFDDIYKSLVETIAQGRGMKPQDVTKLIDRGHYTAQDALKAGLIDSIKHRQDFVADLKAQYGKDIDVVMDYGGDDDDDVPDNIFAAFEMLMKLLNPSPKEYTDPTLAIVYVEGLIQTGEAKSSPFGTSSGAYSTTIRRALDEAAQESAVKAVVLRVDSGGGSALASEIILDATKRVAAKKPLIVSMGNVAGSGGYYVTCGSNTVFADRSTITSSIGVLGGKLVTTGLWDKLGINWHATQRGGLASLFSSAAPFTDQERATIRRMMETVYEVFKDHVVKARGDRLTKPIEELASGRVFTGAQALELGLIDKIGGLEDAIKFAAKKARLGVDYDVRVLPEPPGIFELLSGGAKDDDVLRMSRGGANISLVNLPLFQQMLLSLGRTDPLRFGAVYRQLRKLELIHRENVAVVMPGELLVR
ncbi:MAG: S49 family peptidase [Planctomycetes bacterium]|nr:S49 family peptidase [Planctomycetota bacterium]